MWIRVVGVLVCLALSACVCRRRSCVVTRLPCAPPCTPVSEPPAEPVQLVEPDKPVESRPAPVRTAYRWSQAPVKVYPWPAYVTPEERVRIEAYVEDLEWGGRAMVEAADTLVALDARNADGELKPGTEFRAVGRLVSQFEHVLDHYGEDVTDPECLVRLMTIDRILRRIDGFQERDFGDRLGIRMQSTESEAMKVIKRWNWWFDQGRWSMRREPWDPNEDLVDPEDMESGDGLPPLGD